MLGVQIDFPNLGFQVLSLYVSLRFHGCAMYKNVPKSHSHHEHLGDDGCVPSFDHPFL